MRPRPFGQRPPKGKGRGYALAVEDDEGEGDEVFLDEGDQDYDEEAFEGGEATDEGPMESLVQDMDFAEDQELAEAWPPSSRSARNPGRPPQARERRRASCSESGRDDAGPEGQKTPATMPSSS